ncbi:MULTISPECIES: ABC transporter ATP-binding protein [unclassified Pseudoalteromonas]|uniref:ABC transporter ATP-binding protein n=1 Tax=unclassified Pseudoalteromonas TaxID=194690 RepID=UPI0005A7D135|nr:MULTISPECIES: ABC transporter ATP-binding protein [unclassified Pseudoalteromonas]
MSSNIAISVENISKNFHIYNKPQDRLKQMISIGGKDYYDEYCAVNDVSFKIRKGETVGIVGKNGSGKSTLLQLICGILTPTKGVMETNGRVAALLELGSGFNIEFTGRENVYFNATILGLTQQEIDHKYDEIVNFADIGIFIDQPVKTYSSGMMMRLAFAVAINVEPQILIVDEALSVGDELFQRKCFAKIQEIKESGATILFVSHSAGAIVELCDRALLLDAGQLVLSGTPKQVISKYQRLLHAPKEKHTAILEEIKESISTEDEEFYKADVKEEFTSTIGEYDFFDPNLKAQSTINYTSEGAVINDICILNSNGQTVNILKRGKNYIFRYVVQFDQAAFNVRAGNMFKTTTGVELGGIQSHSQGNGIKYVEAGTTLQFTFNFKCTLLPGTFFLNAGVVGNKDSSEVFLHRIVDACVFRVVHENSLRVTGLIDFSSTDSRINTVKCFDD